jgi:hypothetical protein
MQAVQRMGYLRETARNLGPMSQFLLWQMSRGKYTANTSASDIDPA